MVDVPGGEHTVVLGKILCCVVRIPDEQVIESRWEVPMGGLASGTTTPTMNAARRMLEEKFPSCLVAVGVSVRGESQVAANLEVCDLAGQWSRHVFDMRPIFDVNEPRTLAMGTRSPETCVPITFDVVDAGGARMVGVALHLCQGAFVPYDRGSFLVRSAERKLLPAGEYRVVSLDPLLHKDLGQLVDVAMGLDRMELRLAHAWRRVQFDLRTEDGLPVMAGLVQCSTALGSRRAMVHHGAGDVYLPVGPVQLDALAQSARATDVRHVQPGDGTQQIVLRLVEGR